MSETTYEEYRRAIAAQKQRDRERFLGIDSHPEEPMYSAETGKAVRPAWNAGGWYDATLRFTDWSFQALRLNDAQVNAIAARWLADLSWVATSEANPDA